jgi:hypothetical protein
MTFRFTAAAVSGLVLVSACGGSSESSVANSPETTFVANTNAASGSNGEASIPTTQPETAVTTLLPLGGDPADLLIDSSFDIGAIDGPVVLWFWAPG